MMLMGQEKSLVPLVRSAIVRKSVSQCWVINQLCIIVSLGSDCPYPGSGGGKPSDNYWPRQLNCFEGGELQMRGILGSA